MLEIGNSYLVMYFIVYFDNDKKKCEEFGELRRYIETLLELSGKPAVKCSIKYLDITDPVNSELPCHIKFAPDGGLIVVEENGDDAPYYLTSCQDQPCIVVR